MFMRTSAMTILACASSVSAMETANEWCKRTVAPTSTCNEGTLLCNIPVEGGPVVSCSSFPEAGKLTGSGALLLGGGPAGSSPAPGEVFLWVGWPSQVADDHTTWANYYGDVLRFVEGNAARLSVTKLILRVPTPDMVDGSILVTHADASSLLFRELLDHLPENVDIQVHPSLSEGDAPVWASYFDNTTTALEGVFQYVSNLNTILAHKATRVSGIVVDYHDQWNGRGLLRKIPNVSQYKRQNSAHTHSGSLTFGASIPYEDAEAVVGLSGHIDQFYVQMYDLVRRDTGTRLDAWGLGAANHPVQLLKNLKDLVKLDPATFASPKIRFTWSLQKAGGDPAHPSCVYPADIVDELLMTRHQRCGARDHFGAWESERFVEFIELLKSQIPEVRGKAHGLNEFAMMPTAWM